MLPRNIPWDQALTKWPAQIDPVLGNLLIKGILLDGISFINGTTVVNHTLGRTPIGWFLVAPQAAMTVYQAASQPNPALTLTLISNAAGKSSLWVF